MGYLLGIILGKLNDREKEVYEMFFERLSHSRKITIINITTRNQYDHQTKVAKRTNIYELPIFIIVDVQLVQKHYSLKAYFSYFIF